MSSRRTEQKDVKEQEEEEEQEDEEAALVLERVATTMRTGRDA